MGKPASKKRPPVLSMEFMEEVRVANSCPRIADLFIKFGMPVNITRRRAECDTGIYLRAAHANNLANYQPPGYVVAGIKAYLGANRRPRHTRHDIGDTRRQSAAA